jgi:uncharacterized phage protein gp47/JayE
VPSETAGTGSVEQYAVSGTVLETVKPLADGSWLEVDYEWDNNFADGANVESDDVYRDRIKAGITAAAKGTLAAIRSAVLSVTGISGCTVDDYSTDTSIESGNVEIFAWSSAGVLSTAKKSEVIAAVEDVRAAGIQITVSGPIPVYVAIGMTVYVPEDQGYVLSTIEDDVESAITDWLNAFTVGQDIKESELVGLVEDVTGVSYVDLTSITVEGYDDPTDSSVSQYPPHDSSPYWDFDSATGGWNVIQVNSGYIVKPDTTATGTAISVTAEYE